MYILDGGLLMLPWTAHSMAEMVKYMSKREACSYEFFWVHFLGLLTLGHIFQYIGAKGIGVHDAK